MPRHFGRTVMVFRAIPSPAFRFEKSGSSSCGLGLSSRVRRVHVGPNVQSALSRGLWQSGRLPWGLFPLRGVNPASPLVGEHPELTYVPSAAFLALSTAYSSLNLADLFHPAATSRFRAPEVSSLEPAVPPRRWPLPPRRWLRPPVPVARHASRRRVDLEVLIRSEIRSTGGGFSPA
jgi:hypothetical protein